MAERGDVVRATLAEGAPSELARGFRLLRVSLALYAIETLAGVVTLGYAPFVDILWGWTPTGPYLITVIMAANGVLLAAAGLGVFRLEKVARRLSVRTEQKLLASRFSYLAGLAVCAGLVPTWLVVLLSPVGSVYPPVVDGAILWGAFFLAIGLIVVAADVLRRREIPVFSGGPRRAVLVVGLLASWTGIVPVLALLANASTGYASYGAGRDSLGLRVSAILGGAEASFLLLAAVAGPPLALAPRATAKLVSRGFLAGFAAIVLECVLALALQPPVISPWLTAPVQGVPPVAWGAPAAVLVVFSVVQLVLACRMAVSESDVVPVRVPPEERPPWWAPYVLPGSGIRGDMLNRGVDLSVVTLALFLLLVFASLVPRLGPILGGGYYGTLFGWIGILPPVALAVLLGTSLFLLKRATSQALPRIRDHVLLARAAYWLGLGTVFEILPVSFTILFGSRYGPSKDQVLEAIWWGFGLSLPMITAALLPAMWRLAHRPPERGRAMAAVLLGLGAVLALAVPLVAILVTSPWQSRSTTYLETPPGVYVVMYGAGVEAALAMLAAAVLPARVLVPSAAQRLLRASLGLGVAAVAASVLGALVLVPSPESIGVYFLFFWGGATLPWFSWAPVPTLLEGISGLLLLLAYLETRVDIPGLPVATRG